MAPVKLTKLIVTSYLGLFLSQLIWAAATPVIKVTLDYIPPLTFLFVRFLLVGVLILPYSLYLLQKIKVARRDYFNIFMLGIFSQTSLALFFLGLNYTSSMDAAIISTLGPLLSIAAGHYFYNEKVNSGVKLGVAITIIGTLFVAIEPMMAATTDGFHISQRILGNFLIILNNIAFLLYVVWSKISFGQTPGMLKKALHFIHLKPMSKHYSPAVIATLAFYTGLITMLPLALLENLGLLETTVNYDLMFLSYKPILGILYMAVFSSIVAYYTFEWALKRVSVSDTAIFGYLSPILTVPFSYILLKELPTTYAIIGGVIVFIGVIVTELALHFHEKGKLSVKKATAGGQ